MLECITKVCIPKLSFKSINHVQKLNSKNNKINNYVIMYTKIYTNYKDNSYLLSKKYLYFYLLFTDCDYLDHHFLSTFTSIGVG